MEATYIALDLETTGLEAGKDEIIEIGAVKFRGIEVLDQYQTFVRPRQIVPMKISRLTGIVPNDLANAPTFNQVGADFARFLKTYPIVGHSIAGDLKFMAAQGLRVTQQSFDTFELATLLMPQLPNYSLSTIAEHLQIDHPDAHRALADADVSRQVFIALLDRLADLSVAEIHQIAEMTSKLQWSLASLFGDLAKRRVKTLWTAPVSPMPKSSQRPAALEPTGNRDEIDAHEIGAFFGDHGLLSQQFEGYESRPQQVEMAQTIAETLNIGDNLIVEAGTGTGKSMAYLVPAAQWSRQRGERVVISTNTINLQDQLISKDIPALQAILAKHDDGLEPLRAVQLKGRSNYLCLKRYDEVRQRKDHTDDEIRALVKVQLWIPSTQTGDRAELMLIQNEANAWNSINVNPDLCARQRCPLYDQCFYYKARAEAENAHIVVANHALLLSDVKTPGILPRYDHLVIDEAHNLEDVATDQLGFGLSHNALIDMLDGIHQTGGARLVSGLLSEWQAQFRLSTVDPRTKGKLEELSDELKPVVDKARESANRLFMALLTIMNYDRNATQYDPRLRLIPKIRAHADWEYVERAWENLSFNMKTLHDKFSSFQTILEGLENKDISDYDTLVMRVKGIVTNTQEIQRQMDLVIYGNEETVSWLTLDQKRNELSVQAAPIDVAPVLVEELWSKKRASILVSATLSVNRSFAYPKQRLGLDQAAELQLDSPFDYANSTLLYLPTDMPEPNEKAYQRALEETLIELCKATNGRALVLFTANTTLRQTYNAISAPLESAEITTLAQGVDGSRRSLIQRFKNDPRTVLLGTASVWEGVDVPGDALSVLVITKLPFAVPTDPVVAARSEQFEDAFGEYSVPQAILKFKQGFGRLIRSKGDRGIVVVLDRRLLSKNYGKTFVNSLPDCRIERKPLANLATTAARWLV